MPAGASLDKSFGRVTDCCIESPDAELKIESETRGAGPQTFPRSWPPDGYSVSLGVMES